MYFTLCIFSAGLRTEEPFAMLSGTKKTYLLERMQEAEQAAQQHNQRKLYQVVRSLAPKTQRSRPQLRDARGQMLTRSEEATCFHQHFTAKFTAPSNPRASECE